LKIFLVQYVRKALMPVIDPDTKKEKAPYFNVAQPSSESGFRKGILIDSPEGLGPIVGLRR
jgi:hypothetical protein